MLLNLGNILNKCSFTTARYYQSKLQMLHLHRNVRGFKRCKRVSKNQKVKEPEISKFFAQANIEIKPLTFSRLCKPLCFTIAFCGASYVGAVMWEYENIKTRTRNFYFSISRNQLIHKGWRGDVERWWKSLTPGDRVFIPICLLNTIVFCAWHVPSLKPVMIRYFCSTPASSITCWPMVFSMFSHQGLLHLLANMYVLYSFSTVAVSSLGKEQFMAFYLMSGVVSNFASYVYKTIFCIQNMSLGASGAIMGVIGYLSTEYPDMLVKFILLPYTFTAGSAIKCLIALDLTGCILHWKIFDHAAHLGGTVYGIFWEIYNYDLWGNREPIMQTWHSLRKEIFF